MKQGASVIDTGFWEKKEKCGMGCLSGCMLRISAIVCASIM